MMTKKRCTLKNKSINYMEIIENDVVLFFEDGQTQKFTGENFIKMLNDLNFELKDCKENKLFSRRQLEEENEQLKKGILDCLFNDKPIGELATEMGLVE